MNPDLAPFADLLNAAEANRLPATLTLPEGAGRTFWTPDVNATLRRSVAAVEANPTAPRLTALHLFLTRVQSALADAPDLSLCEPDPAQTKPRRKKKGKDTKPCPT